MPARTNTSGEIYRETVHEGSRTLTIDIKSEREAGWRLRILGGHDHFTEWTDFFPSREQALREARLAIHQEGFDAFHRDPEIPDFNQLGKP